MNWSYTFFYCWFFYINLLQSESMYLSDRYLQVLNTECPLNANNRILKHEIMLLCKTSKLCWVTTTLLDQPFYLIAWIKCTFLQYWFLAADNNGLFMRKSYVNVLPVLLFSAENEGRFSPTLFNPLNLCRPVF